MNSKANWPLFILGTQRSGTTLLTKILSAHPNIYVQNELHLTKIFREKNTAESIADNLHKVLSHYHAFQPYVDEPDVVWGLKDPLLTNHIDALELMLPHSKFIVIVRDPRGVTNSYIENQWGLGTNVYTGAQRWLSEVNIQLNLMDKAPKQFLFIKYEDLIADLDTHLKRVCRFLNIEWAIEMQNYHHDTSGAVGVNRENKHTLNKPDPALSLKWQKKLSKRQISVIESVTGDMMTRLGYQKLGTDITLTKWEKAYYQYHQKVIGDLQLRYRWRKAKIQAYFRKMKQERRSA